MTQGPWKADRRAPGSSDWEVFYQSSPGEPDFQFVAEFLTEEDARLIAAAPRMAKLLVYIEDQGYEPPSTQEAIRALLAEIRGDDASG